MDITIPQSKFVLNKDDIILKEKRNYYEGRFAGQKKSKKFR